MAVCIPVQPNANSSVIMHASKMLSPIPPASGNTVNITGHACSYTVFLGSQIVTQQTNHICSIASYDYDKEVVLYSVVSSAVDRSKRCTLFALPSRPVHSDTNSASPGSILARQQLHGTTIHSHFHPVLIYTAE